VSRITTQEAQAWAEGTKLTISALDVNLLPHIEEEVIDQLRSAFSDTANWVDQNTTPKLVRTIISKMYVAWLYDRTYSEDIVPGQSNYATLLQANANMLIAGLLAGTITLPEETSGNDIVEPVFYPTDASSAQCPTFGPDGDPSLGPAAFSMGMRF